MKKTSLWIVVGVLVGILAFLVIWQVFGKGGVKSSVRNSFDEVTSHLDKGGDLYLYANTEKLIKTVDEFVTTIRKSVTDPSSTGGTSEEEKAFDFLYNLFKKSGLTEISGIGISSVTVSEGFNHSKIVIHHYKEKSTGILWQILPKETGSLDELEILPADTVMAGFTNIDVKKFWALLSEELMKSGIPSIKNWVIKLVPEMLKEGIDLNKILSSIQGRMGYVVTLDNSVMKTIPLGYESVKIPDPALALVFSVNDDYVFNLFKKMVKDGSTAKISEKDDMKRISFKVPSMPITVEPTIVLAKGRLILASNNKIVDAIFAAEKNGNGLTTGTEFKQMSVYMPKKGNKFSFISSRLMETYSNVLQKTLGKANNYSSPNTEMMKTLMNLFPRKLSLYTVTQYSEEGSVTFANHTMGVESLLIMPIFSTGIISAIAIPNLLSATTKGKEKTTMGDMKAIGVAIESYMTDYYYAPVAATINDLKPMLEPFYIKVLPLKDAWGNDFLYIHGEGDTKDIYSIASPGKDGVFNGWEQRGYYDTTDTTTFSDDIIFSNGTFVFGPRVK